MSHFLARLVDRARGIAPRVEPLVAPRFVQTPIVEIAAEIETPPSEPRHQQSKVDEKSSPRGVVQQKAPGEEPESNIIGESQKSSLRQEPAKLLVPMKERVVEPATFVRPSPAADRSVPAVRNGVVKGNSSTTSRAKRPRPGTPLTTTFQNLERGVFVPNESPEEPPVVRITIGRIDVRATSAAAPTRKPATPSEPKLTLDAYLKSRREGTR